MGLSDHFSILKNCCLGGHAVCVLREWAGSKQEALEKFPPSSISLSPTEKYSTLQQLHDHFEGGDEERVETA